LIDREPYTDINQQMVEQSQQGFNYYDLNRLYDEAVQRNFKGDGNTVGNVISGATYALVWGAFTKYVNRYLLRAI
jgi:hypothetical protein